MNLFKRNKCQAKGCKENYTPLGFCPNGHYHAHVEFYEDRDDKTGTILFV
tara:strand:+ start:676 stop:825 length:150 start_codon:yes stop_codon:yes gene_type:complete